MFREVHIHRVNDDELTPLMANAATPRRYKQVFGDDLLTLFANAEKDTEDGGKVYKIDFIAELAYIMSMQAQAADGKARLDKLNSNGFLDWLEVRGHGVRECRDRYSQCLFGKHGDGIDG